MNELQIVVGESALTGAGQAHTAVSLTVSVDQQVIGEGLTVDFQELYRTLRYSSEMWLWTSIDGEPMDVGVREFVAVDRGEQSVKWEWYSPITVEAESLSNAREIQCRIFDLSAYDQAIHRAWWEVCSMLRRRTNIRVIPSSMSARTIFELREWIHSSDAEPWQGEFLTTSWRAIDQAMPSLVS